MTSTTYSATSKEKNLDSTLLFMLEQRTTTFTTTKKLIDDFLPELEKSIEDINKLYKRAFDRGQEYQNSRISNPSKEELESERNAFLTEYIKFKGTHEKAELVYLQISKAIAFVSPPKYDYYLVDGLKKYAPELYKQTQNLDIICLSYMKELKLSRKEITQLKERLLTCIQDKTLSEPLQNFCLIVDNKGKPLPWMIFGLNRYQPPAFYPLRTIRQLRHVESKL